MVTRQSKRREDLEPEGARQRRQELDAVAVVARDVLSHHGGIHRWEVQGVEPIAVERPDGVGGVPDGRVSGRLDLVFGKTKVAIVPQSIVPAQEVMDFLGEILGGPVETG